MDEDPDFKLLAVVADAPLAHFRRTLDQLIAKEQTAPLAEAVQAPASKTTPRIRTMPARSLRGRR